MRRFSQFLSRYYNLFIFSAILFAIAFTLLPSVRFASPIYGIPITPVENINYGWKDGKGNAVRDLPCSISSPGDTLTLSLDLSDISIETGKVIVFQTRYAVIRVWADDTLVYQTAGGEENALGSRWHFIQTDSCMGASQLQVEYTRYDTDSLWRLSEVLMDSPEAVLVHLVSGYIPAILFWAFSILFALFLIFIGIFLAREKIMGISVILALALFIFLSGQWILLDSKITTLFGGNYSLTYFFSYCAFYLMMVPFLLYIQLMLNTRNRLLRWLTCLFIGNTILCMILHLFGLVPIRRTTFVVHILIVLSMAASTWELYGSIWKRGEKKTVITFWGTVVIYVSGLFSIILYHAGILRPTNNTALYSWALMFLILCMTLDVIFSLSRLVKQKQQLDHYRQLAIKDNMTLLGNRNAYELRLKQLLSESPKKLVFIYFDVDDLKRINDTYGHHMGDQIIYLSAQCIRETFEDGEDSYRIGGDEFCVIRTSTKDIETKLRQFDSLFRSKSRHILSTTVSYGWAQGDTESNRRISMADILKIQKEADENLYQNKRKNKEALQQG